MRGRGNEAQIRELADLARLRELAALEELGRVTRQLFLLEARISDLRTLRYTAEGLGEAGTLAKWQEWRQVELRRLGIEQAALRRDRANAESRCGRLVAEREVVEKVIENLRAKKRKDADRARSYCS